MAKYVVPVWVRQRAIVMVEAENAKEAARLAEDGGWLVGADINATLTINGVRRGKIRRLTGEQVEWATAGDHLGGGVDNDKGVPFEDYGPDGWDADD